MKERSVAPEKLLEMYRKMLLIRHFEDRVYRLFLSGEMPGTIHLYQGQEAVAVGVCTSLRKEDVITSTHRPHGHGIAKGVPVKSMMAELFAKTTGCCKGKGGSMHMGDIEVGMVPAIAIVGGGIPVATGIALAFKMKRLDRVAVSFFGDGASNEGAFHEAINMGSIWRLPLIYVCENNLYGASTRIGKVMKLEDIAERASCYGIPGIAVDGNEVISVYKVAKEAIERARKGEGPTLIECKTYRRGGHSRSDPGQYRDEKEERTWLAKDPISRMHKGLIKMGILTEEKGKRIKNEVTTQIEEAVEFARKSPYPKPEDALKDVFA